MSENAQEMIFNELQTRFATLKDAYQRLDAEADKQIVRWRYAEESAFELRADHFRRFNAAPGKLVDDEPTNAYIFHAYGFDAQDRIIYDALFQAEENPRTCTFYEYRDDHIELVEYGVQLYTDRYHINKVGQVSRLPGQNPTAYAEFSQANGQEVRLFETYGYDESGRIARVASSFKSTSHLTPENKRGLEHGLDQQRMLAKMLGTGDLMPQFEQIVNQALNRQMDIQTDEIYEYEGDTIKRIVAKSDNAGQKSERIAYEAPLPDQTDESLFEAARTSLRSAIIENTVQFSGSDRLCYLIMSYDAVADDGVGLVPGFESHRSEWEAETDDHSYHSFILDQTYHNMIMVDDPPDYARFIRIYRRDRRWDDIRKLLTQVARDLNAHVWALPVTDDFIVYASDHEAMRDINEEIAACVPENRLQILRAKGWVD